jgi:dTDP-4-amino-4,6-dideoxygalactose transaminase
MEVPLLDLRAQYAAIRDAVRSAVDEVFESQRFIMGPQVAALEAQIARYCEVPFAVGVASGTDALLLSLKAVGAGPGDSVITVPYTFFATAGAIVNVGARPLFVDIDDATYNMDPGLLERLLADECTYDAAARCVLHRKTNTTVKAVIPVHLFGQCADMEEILEIARRRALPVIEDAAQALGARYRQRAAGAMGDLGCFSFFPSKNLGGAGDGGMIVTSDAHLAAKLRALRAHGAETKYYHSTVGFNSRLDEIQAAVLGVKLGRLDGWNEGRRRNAAAYEEGLRAAAVGNEIGVPAVRSDRSHIYNQFVIRCSRRDDLQAFLKRRGIGTEIYYPLALHEQECFRGLGYAPADFPVSHAAAQQTLALPVFPELTAQQLSYVVSSLTEFCC